MNACFGGFEGQIQFGPSATHPIEPCYAALAALLFLVGTSPLRRLPCRAHQRLQALVVPQADSRLSENEVSLKPCYTLANAAHHSPLGRVPDEICGLERKNHVYPLL